MGQKVNPTGFRLGTIYSWNSKWFAKKDQYKKYLQQDLKMRKYLMKKFRESAVSKVGIERSSQKVVVTLHSAKPGFIIGRGGAGIDDLKKELKKKFFASEKVVLEVNVKEVSNPNLDAQLIVYMIADALEKRVPFRKAAKQALGKVERSGAQGVKIMVSGRLNGVDIARSEKFISGKIPLHTLRADIDYSRGVANTTYGVIGIKVWIYKGEVFNNKNEEAKSLSKKK
jgi:small subunit ribosomal protein S3